MGNQAQQSQELELWQVVSSSGNGRGRQTRPGRAETQARADVQRRGNVSSYNKARAARSARMGNAGNARSAGTRRTGNVRSAGAGQTVKAEFASTVRTGKARPAGAVRTGNIRSVSPKQTARAQTSKKKKKVGRRARFNQFLAFMWIAAMTAAIVFMGKNFYQSMQKSPVIKEDKTEKSSPQADLPFVEDTERKPQIREDLLTISEYNRPGTTLAEVRNIFVHYTANPGTSAAQNRSYFESLGQTHERAASAHFIIGYEGEIVQCIPLDEEAYAVVERNGDSISIECCYLEEDGSFTQETYDSLIEMLAWLTDKYDLEPEDILRHYDCGGKKCPIYYVEHEDAWQKLLNDVANYTL